MAVESKAKRGRNAGRAEAVRCNWAGFVVEADSRLCVKQRDAIRIVVCLPGLVGRELESWRRIDSEIASRNGLWALSIQEYK